VPKRIVRIREGEPLLDIASYGRNGPHETGGRLTPGQIEQIQRTVRRTPEVVVKILPRASNDLKAVGKHLDYIGRKGELELESDDGERLGGTMVKDLLDDWDLDIDDVRRQTDLAATNSRAHPKLVHKLMFSMPSGTPSAKVLRAVRNFAREEFWGQHRYVFTLHTDEPHPHVHLVLKAVNEQGVRLNIKKATLRHWRCEFARNLRLLGVEANATERAVRGDSRNAKRDGIYRADLRGDSTYIRARAKAVDAELLKGGIRAEPGKHTLVETRKAIEDGWRSVANLLAKDGQENLAIDIERFVDRMPVVRTERELLADNSVLRTKAPPAHAKQSSR
jgi:hypothetical protein